jgi:hypothetical protein
MIRAVSAKLFEGAAEVLEKWHGRLARDHWTSSAGPPARRDADATYSNPDGTNETLYGLISKTL